MPMLVTLFLFSYNQEKYIEDACKAVLAQSYSPLEIIFSDDCSSDQTFELVKKSVERYSGPHQIKLNRNERNIGLIGHVNKSFEMASGELIVAAAGDDISMPDRVECLVAAYKNGKEKALVIHSSATKIDEFNNDLGSFIPPIVSKRMTLSDMAGCQGLYIGATAAWSPLLYKKFGPIVFSDAYEDLVFGFRAALKDALVYVDSPLVRYRVNVGITGHKITSLAEFSDRIANRKKTLKAALDVYEQRLKDLDLMENDIECGVLRTTLIRNIGIQENKLLFYREPLALLPHIFSRNIICIVKLIAAELWSIAEFRQLIRNHQRDREG